MIVCPFVRCTQNGFQWLYFVFPHWIFLILQVLVTRTINLCYLTNADFYALITNAIFLNIEYLQPAIQNTCAVVSLVTFAKEVNIPSEKLFYFLSPHKEFYWKDWKILSDQKSWWWWWSTSAPPKEFGENNFISKALFRLAHTFSDHSLNLSGWWWLAI